MDPDQPSQSPFASGSREVSSAEAPIAPTPDPYQGAEPRLGIIHLLVWTACVALTLGVDQSFSAMFSQSQEKSGAMFLRGLYAFGSGAGLGIAVFFWGTIISLAWILLG